MNKSLTSKDTEEAHQVLNNTLIPVWNKAHRWATRVCHCPRPVVAEGQHLALLPHGLSLRQSSSPELGPGWNNKPRGTPAELTLPTLLPLTTLRKKHGRVKVSDPGNDTSGGKGLESENRCSVGKDLEDQVRPTSITTTFTTKPRPQVSYTHGFWTLAGMVTPPLFWAICSNALKPL